MQGGAPRVVWLTLGTDPRAVSVTSAAQRLIAEGRPCHVVWDPLSGDIAQLLPIVRAARALGTREHIEYVPQDCGHPMPSVNREGRLCVQIGVLGSPREPFTSYPMTGLSDLLGWLDCWQIPRRWPAGQPAPYRQADRPRNRALWARGGHYGASQVPDCMSVGPGGIDIDQLTGTGNVSLSAPEPARPAAAIPLGHARAGVPGGVVSSGQRGARAARDVAAATAPLTAAGV